MNNQEYEQKRRECWEEFKNEVFNGNISYSPYGSFDFAFDRAYALGKKKETVTQEEIEKAAKDYAYDVGDSDWEQLRVRDAFVDGANFTFGKQEKDAEDGSLWSRLTDDEKREMQCRYHTNECVLRDHKKRTGDKAQPKAVARMKLLENLFGKENLKTRNNG